MNDIAQMIVQSATKMIKDVCTKETVNASEQGVWAGELWDILAESGMITVGVPEELGGVGCSYRDGFQLLRLAGKFSAPIPLAETYIGNWLLAKQGKKVSDEPLTVMRPNRAEVFRFQKAQDGWLVSGKATSVPWGRFAKQILVFGQTDAGDDALAVVSIGQGNVAHGQNLAGEARDDVAFEQVHVEHSNVTPIELDKVLEHLLYSGAVARTAMLAGALERVLEMSVAHTKERSQFGKPLHRFQAIQQHLAVLAGESVAANTAAGYAIEAYEAGAFAKEIALAKIRASEAAGTSAAIAHQIHAAIGFTYEHTLHQTTRRLWSWRDECGTESEWGERLADFILEPEFGGIWDYLTKRNTLGGDEHI